jgi:hypothetical protein
VKTDIFLRILGCVLAVIFLSVPTFASVHISFTLDDIGAGRWNAVYQIENISLSGSIQQFSIWFDRELYHNISVNTPAPLNADWDERFFSALFIPPLEPSDGFYDALARSTGVVPGQTLRGFMVSFEWLGEGIPVIGQPYQIYDPGDMQTPLYEGITTYVPEPATLLLLVSGSVFAISNHYKRCRHR